MYQKIKPLGYSTSYQPIFMITWWFTNPDDRNMFAYFTFKESITFSTTSSSPNVLISWPNRLSCSWDISFSFTSVSSFRKMEGYNKCIFLYLSMYLLNCPIVLLKGLKNKDLRHSSLRTSCLLLKWKKLNNDY